MGAVTEVAEVHPDTKDLPSKNRVWGFRTPARHRIRKSTSQAAESRRKNAPTPTNIASGISQFLLTDQVGTLRAVADSTGMIVKRIDYDSFGNIVADTNPGFLVPFGFAGGLHDRDTGLVRFGYRDYSPELGRFVAKDPLDFGGGDTNLYAYAMSDPISYVDPNGLNATVCLYTGAGSAGHIGIGVNSSSTVGFYPIEGGLKAYTGTPGIVKPDTKKAESCKEIKTSTEDDQKMSEYIAREMLEPGGDYSFPNNNCTNFVRGVLREANIMTLPLPGPRPYYEGQAHFFL